MTRGPARLPLTPRQARVLNAASDGAPLAVVAERIGTTRQQVAARLAEAYQRLDITYLPRGERRTAAVREARRRGLIDDAAPRSAPTPPIAPTGRTEPLDTVADEARTDRAYWTTRYDH